MGQAACDRWSATLVRSRTMANTAQKAKLTNAQGGATGFTRLSVNLNPEAAAALKAYTEKRHVSYTEAIRRAIAILRFLDEEVSAGREVQVTDGETIEKIVLVN